MDRLSHSNFAFSVANNGLGPEGAKILAEMLRVSTSMKSVNVSGNPIGDEGKAILSNAAEARGMVLQMDNCDLSDY